MSRGMGILGSPGARSRFPLSAEFAFGRSGRPSSYRAIDLPEGTGFDGREEVSVTMHFISLAATQPQRDWHNPKLNRIQLR